MTETMESTAADTHELHSKAIVIDGLASSRLSREQLQRFIEGGVTAVNYTVARPDHGFSHAMQNIAEALEAIEANPDCAILVRTVDDIRRAKTEKKVGLILGLQDALLLEHDLARLRILHALGIRIIQLTYNQRNFVGDGCVEPADGGLSRFGYRVIREMERLGIVLDLSHCGHRTTMDALEACTLPPVFSHANAWELFDSPRNKRREALLLLAEKGGVVGPNLWSPMLRRDRQPEFADFVEHLDYYLTLLGTGHVGFATDHSEGSDPQRWEGLFGRKGIHAGVTGSMGDWYRYGTRYVRGFATVTALPAMTTRLQESGYDREILKGILGANFLRVFRTVWGNT